MIYALFFVGSFIGAITPASVGDGSQSLLEQGVSGNCLIDGREYASETLVPREHPCHSCVCYQGQVTCYWKKCARAPTGCEVMEFKDTCNPSLYICDIPENVRNAPGQQLVTSENRINEPKTTFWVFPQKAVPEASSPHSLVIASENTDGAIRGKEVQPLERHLTPPDPPATAASSVDRPTYFRQGKQGDQENDSKQPSQYGLRTKHKMRFSRSPVGLTVPMAAFLNVNARLPFGIQEKFPLDFNQAADLLKAEKFFRKKRAIKGSFPEHHHHDHHDHHEHDHDEPEDRGCIIQGVPYKLGDVVGVATDICQECRCASQKLFCSPKCCFNPAPLYPLTKDDIDSLSRSSGSSTRFQTAPHPLHTIGINL